MNEVKAKIRGMSHSDFKKAYEEINEYENTGVLRNGLVREVAKLFPETIKNDFRLAIDLMHKETFYRYVNCVFE